MPISESSELPPRTKGRRRKRGGADSGSPSARSPAWKRAFAGFVLASLVWIAFRELTKGFLSFIATDYAFAAFALLGAWMGARGRFKPLWWAAGLCAVGGAVLAYSPLVPWLLPMVTRNDRPQKAPALFVLTAGVYRDGRMSEAAMTRLLKAYEVMGQGYADRLVLAHAGGGYDSWVPLARIQMRRMGVARPIEEIGPVENTHDEAVLVSRLARQRGWERILVVSNAWHLRRVKELFAKQGLDVVGIPALDSDYNAFRMKLGWNRIRAFQDWSHESVGILVYHLRGWI